MNRARYLRLGTTALALSGVLFALFPLTRPWQDAAGTDAGLVAAALDSWWVPAHLSGALGFLLFAFASTAVLGVIMKGPGEPAARSMALLSMLGAGLILPFYGAESFGLHAVAAADGLSDAAKAVIMESIRSGPYALTTFGAGLVIMAVAGICLAISISRLKEGSAVPAIAVAVLLSLYLPQFFGPPWLRIGHGVLLGISLLALAAWHNSVAQRRLQQG